MSTSPLAGFPLPLAEASGPAEPVFAEPWEAQAFAMAVELSRRGVFTWTEWAAALSEEVATEPDDGGKLCRPDQPGNYYKHWLRALEKLVVKKGLLSDGQLAHRKHEWEHAAEHTERGQPIVLHSH
jgi:nitrile hydratase accessory protein